MLQSERRTVNLRYALAIPRGGMERGWKGGRTPGSTHQVIISPGPVSIARDFHLHRCVINEIIFGPSMGEEEGEHSTKLAPSVRFAHALPFPSH